MAVKVSPKRALGFSLVLLLALYGLWRFGHWLYYRYTHAYTEDAFVEADIINVSPLVPGHIAKVLVDESQKVKKGQLLFLIDDRDYRAAYLLAKARLEHAVSRLDVLNRKLAQAEDAYRLTKLLVEDGIRAARHDLEQVKARYERVRRDYVRFKNLYERKAIGKFKFDRVMEEFRRVSELLKIKQIRLRMAMSKRIEVSIKERQIEELKSEIASAKKAVEEARRALEVARVKLEHTKVKSPIDGVVAKKYLHRGDFASAGYPVLALYNPSKVYILANLEETRFEGVKVGNPVDIWVDAYPGRVFKGRVMKILPASAAKFALIPRDVTAGEFTKVVQRIPIKIEILGEGKDLLIPGMSVEVGIAK